MALAKWQALVPIKQGTDGKSRLAGVLDCRARAALIRRMAQHVLAVLGQCEAIERITILSPHRPDGWLGDWRRDGGRGLNPELAAWRQGLGGAPALVFHADLPLAKPEDVGALLAMADKRRVAMATDRAGLGTNALAIADGAPFEFCFGPMSRMLHTAQFPDMPVVRRAGLTIDIDTPDDLRFAETCGFGPEPAASWNGSMPTPRLRNMA